MNNHIDQYVHILNVKMALFWLKNINMLNSATICLMNVRQLAIIKIPALFVFLARQKSAKNAHTMSM